MHGLQLAVFPAHPPTRASTCTRADVQQDWGHHSLLSPDPSHRLSELARAPIPPKSQRHPGGDLSPGLKCSAGSISISPSTHREEALTLYLDHSPVTCPPRPGHLLPPLLVHFLALPSLWLSVLFPMTHQLPLILPSHHLHHSHPDEAPNLPCVSVV